MKSKRNLWLDLYKLFLCWMVISIHFCWDTYWYYPIYRLAVPLFFAISGFFIRREDLNQSLRASAQMIKRSFSYMLMGFALYILFDFVLCYVDGKGVGYYFTTLFYENFLFEFFFLNMPIGYTGAQLWFLIALFVISLVHYVLVRFGKVQFYRWIVPATMLIQLFFGGYMRLFQETDMPIRYTRNAWFMGLPFFGMGYLLAGLKWKKRWYELLTCLALGVFFTLLQVQEEALVKTEVYASTIPATMFMLLFFTGLPSPKADGYYRIFGKSMSFWIYILHMSVGVAIDRIWKIDSLFVRSLVILAVSAATYLLGRGCVKFVLAMKKEGRCHAEV